MKSQQTKAQKVNKCFIKYFESKKDKVILLYPFFIASPLNPLSKVDRMLSLGTLIEIEAQ
jgi:hypothetical protein